MVRETSVAGSMARSAMPGWNVGWGVSLFTCPYPHDAPGIGARRNEAATFGYPRALVLNSGSNTFGYPGQAVLNGGRRPLHGKCGGGRFVPRIRRAFHGTF